jgi:hypothetical protein
MEGSCEHGNKPSYSIKWKFLSSCTTGGFSRSVQLHEFSYLYFGLPKSGLIDINLTIE